MGQKTTTKVSYKVNSLYLTQENQDQDFFQTISHVNPFFYMIDGFRYGFLGKSDGSINIVLIYLTILSVVIWYVAFFLYKKGYKIKS